MLQAHCHHFTMAAGSRYGVTLKQLRELMEHRGHEGVQKIEALGGSSEVARKLNTSASAGLSGDRSDLEHRRDVFGSNTIPPLAPGQPLSPRHLSTSPIAPPAPLNPDLTSLGQPNQTLPCDQTKPIPLPVPAATTTDIPKLIHETSI